jgi:hypothetical protein
MKVSKKRTRSKVKAKAFKPTSLKNTVNTGAKAPSLSQDARKFWCSLSDPFCREAMGAKLPDMFTFPTEPVTYRAKFILTPQPNDYYVVYPHAMFSIAGFNALSTSAPSVGAFTGLTGTLQVGSIVGFLNRVNWGAATNAGAFSIPYQRSRLIGWGARIKNISPAKDVAGEVAVAVLPAGDKLPYCFSNVLSSVMVTPGPSSPGDADEIGNDISFCSGIPSNGVSVNDGTYGHPLLNSMDGFPTVDTFTCAELAESGGICVTPKINSPAAWRFNGTSANRGQRCGGVSMAVATTQGGPSTGNSITLDELRNTAGHNVIIIAPGTVAGVEANRFEVEVVYHYEMIPDGNRLNASALVSPSPLGRPQELEKVVRSSLLTPLYQFVKHEGQTVYNNFKQALPGLMTKAAMLALA